MSTHSYIEYQLHDFKTDLYEPIDLFNISNCNRRIKSYRYQPFHNRKEIFPALIDFYEDENQIFTIVSSCLKVCWKVTFTYSNSTIEAIEKGVKYVQS